MQSELVYKGRIINGMPMQLAESGKRTTGAHILKDHGSHVDDCPYAATNEWESIEEAIFYSLDLECIL